MSFRNNFSLFVTLPDAKSSNPTNSNRQTSRPKRTHSSLDPQPQLQQLPQVNEDVEIKLEDSSSTNHTPGTKRLCVSQAPQVDEDKSQGSWVSSSQILDLIDNHSLFGQSSLPGLMASYQDTKVNEDLNTLIQQFSTDSSDSESSSTFNLGN